MSILQDIYNAACDGRSWQHEDTDLCGCRGGGWYLSDVDTSHQCSFHYDPRSPHPESSDPNDGINPVGLIGPYYLPDLAGFSGPRYDFRLVGRGPAPAAPVFDLSDTDDIPF
jgi:hypothetical protein